MVAFREGLEPLNNQSLVNIMKASCREQFMLE